MRIELLRGKKDAVRQAIALAIGLVSMGPALHAQAPATSFAELRSRLSVGATVFVTNQAAETVKGRVRQLSDTILVLRRGPDDLTLTASDIRRIARRGHTLRNGALIGLTAGFLAGGAWAASQPCSFTCFSSTGGVVAFGGLFGSIGMGVGAVVGASLRKEHVIFERAATGHPSAEITPLRPRGGAGLARGN